MTNPLPASADRRSLAVSAAIGGCVGLAIGSAYVAGALARASVDEAQARLVAGGPALRLAAPADKPAAFTAVTSPPSLTRVDLRGSAAPARDLECLSQAIYYEARGEVERGREAVAQVVINRTHQPRFPRSICGVVFQHASSGCAFAFACDGQTRHPLEPAAWREARRIAQRTLSGFAMPELRTATEFRSGSGVPQGLERVTQIGAHVFYRWTGRAAHVAAPPPERSSAAPTVAPTLSPPPAPVLVKVETTLKPDPTPATPAA